MRFISVYRKMPTIQIMMRLVLILSLILPIILAGVLYLVSFKTNSPTMLFAIIVGLLAMDAIGFLLARREIGKTLNAEVEINDIGIQNLTPGHETLIRWDEIQSFKKVLAGQGLYSIKVITPNQKLTLIALLVPDDPNAPVLKRTMTGNKYVYPDGHEEVYHFEQWRLYQELLKYRPDLKVN